VTYTLIADGSSDRVLVPMLTWSLRRHGVKQVVDQWADFSRIPRAYKGEQRLRLVIELYPCDLLFIHRAAEGQPSDVRRQEIAATANLLNVPHVPVVPVRMTEAWLLANEAAIRAAAGNPNGSDDLQLPAVRRIEEIPNPKQMLHELLVRASGLNARRRSRLPVDQQVHRITSYIDDFSALDELRAFSALQQDIKSVLGHIAQT
jgi:hypothetical protein